MVNDLEQGNEKEPANVSFSPSTTFGRTASATNKDDSSSSNSARKKGVRRMISLHSFSSVDTKVIETAISNLSNDNQDPTCLHQDAQDLQAAIRSTGSQAYGIVAVEAWVMNQKQSRLEAPEGALWISPLLMQDEENQAARRLVDPTHPQYAPAEPHAPGFGLIGDLWMRAITRSPGSSSRPISVTAGAQGSKREHGESFVGLTRIVKDGSSLDKDTREAYFIQRSYQHYGHNLQWRDMQTLWLDPDTPKSYRLKVLLDAGLGYAAAVPFSEHGQEGLVIYFVRPSANRTVVSAMENQEFLYRQAKLIGVLISSLVAGRALKAARRRALRASWKQFVRNLTDRHSSKEGVMKASSVSRDEDEKFVGNSLERAPDPRGLIWVEWAKRGNDYFRKFRGGDGQIAPPLSIQQSLWTLFGSFCGLILLSAYNEWIQDESDGKYELLIGPFGAAMTLLYGLHSAPASQPRNVVMGQVVAGAVSLVFTYIPEDVMPVWIRRAVGPSFAIAAMTALGVIHPPAGAHSVIYASGEYNWLFYFLVVVGAVISVAPAVIVNNLSNRRQYPIYWGYWSEYLRRDWRVAPSKTAQSSKEGSPRVHMT